MSASQSSSQSGQLRSHVVLLSVPDDSVEDLQRFLERLHFHRGLTNQLVSFRDQESALSVAEQYGLAVLQDSSFHGRCSALMTGPPQLTAADRLRLRLMASRR